ncbi:MAG: nucleotide exchange factor GrpE [Deltaproteobacteria bacterium]
MEDHKKKKNNKHQNHPPEGNTGEETIKDEKKMKDGEKEEIEELRKKLEEKEKEAQENLDRLLRMAADLDNYKKRAAREKEEWIRFANEDLLKAVLPFADNLERAVNHSEKTKDIQSLVEGVKLTIQQLLQALNKFGVSRFESVGKPFDPAVHEAMLVVETDREKPHHVIQEFQKGYLLNDRLLRPATVSVSKPLEEIQETE